VNHSKVNESPTLITGSGQSAQRFPEPAETKLRGSGQTRQIRSPKPFPGIRVYPKPELQHAAFCGISMGVIDESDGIAFPVPTAEESGLPRDAEVRSIPEQAPDGRGGIGGDRWDPEWSRSPRQFPIADTAWRTLPDSESGDLEGPPLTGWSSQ